ncbi:MAG: NigD-like N-terminal domain-containing protein [Prevotella sp.]|nr:NigD-like N-terminal domain-containing protein [Prevotella sp.]
MKKILLPLLIGLLIGCTNDAYDSGDGTYSYLRADFVEAHTISTQTIDQATTDDGTTLRFNPYATAEWAEKADTLYRALIYYHDGTTAGEKTVESIAVNRVPVLRPVTEEEFEGEQRTDPVSLESIWLSTNKKYINLALLLKTGKADDPEAVQRIGMIKSEDAEGRPTLRLLHDQGTVPQYYTTRLYLSIPTTDLKAPSQPPPVGEAPVPPRARIIVNTYKGIIEKTIEL